MSVLESHIKELLNVGETVIKTVRETNPDMFEGEEYLQIIIRPDDKSSLLVSSEPHDIMISRTYINDGSHYDYEQKLSKIHQEVIQERTEFEEYKEFKRLQGAKNGTDSIPNF